MDMKQRIIDFIEVNPNLDLKEMSLSLNKSGLKLGPQAYWNPIKLKKFMLENINISIPGVEESFSAQSNGRIFYGDQKNHINNKQSTIKKICDLNLNEEQFIAVVKAILGE